MAKRILFIIGLLVLGAESPASAEWVKAAKDVNGTEYYVDPDTIRRKGGFVKQWELGDYTTAIRIGNVSAWSAKSQLEYDCEEEAFRILTTIYFSGNMGWGKVLYTEEEAGKSKPVTPESVIQIKWNRVCNKQ